MTRTVSRRTWLIFAAGSAFALAVACLVAPGLIPARAAAPDAGSAVPLGAATVPIQTRNAVLEFAARDDLSMDSLVEVSRASAASSYRSAIVGVDSAGNVRVAFASQAVVTSFAEAQNLFRSGPVAVELATAGTRTELKQIDLTVVVEPSISRVDLEAANGNVRELDLTRWPVGGYSSASLIASDPGDFPRAVRAYDAKGELVTEQSVGSGPVCPAAKPDCMD